MLTQYQKLKEILREMFQMDQADLDFGIYRIMNAKRAEIEKFLDDELLPQVKEEFAKYRGTEIEDKKKELTILEKTIQDSGMNPDESPKVKGLREEIAKYGDDDALANEVFSHLSSFFRRYYDNGDFMSLRRYKKDTYAIPYEGEEVKLHWANADQYYIKSSEYLRDYAFKLSDGKRAHFKLVEATQEKDNIKTEAGKERKFRLHEETPVRIEAGELFIQFVHLPDKEKQENHNKKTIELLKSEFGKKLQGFDELFSISPTEKNPRRTLIEKHLASYTARFNFDFFIHKDLGGFLSRELDFYVKNEILFVDDLDAQDEKKLKSVVARVKVIKHIARKVIAFLAQLEDFQKKLWLKKKFVVASGYCITLDRVPETLYPEIIKNSAQIEEWIRLFAINEIEQSTTTLAYSSPLTLEFLKANPFLVLDTKCFDENFKEKLLSSFENLDEATDGIIINSENFQALNLLLEKYREQIKCVYIDPPYNTGDSKILYKNEFDSSAWLSLMKNRMEISKPFLADDFVYFIAIDDYEMVPLSQFIDTHFNFRREMIVINHHPQGGKAATIANTHEYMLALVDGGSDRKLVGRTISEDTEERPYKRSGTAISNFRSGRPNSFYAILVDPSTKKIVGIENPPGKDSPYPKEDTTEGYKRIYPIGNNDSERVWRNAYDTGRKLFMAGKLKSSEGYTIYQLIEHGEKKTALFSNWVDSKYNAGTNGANLLNNIIGAQNPFSYPKSIFTVEDALFTYQEGGNNIALDFFGGSGTTAHAVINLNRADDGSRKYILIEMGDHFNTVLKPRIQKVVYSKDWKEGKPVSREGTSHMFKYLRLESYDDTLDNLVMHRTDVQQKTLEKMEEQAREDYILSYLLDVETKASDSLLNIDRFSDPFNYTLKIRKDNELKAQKVDLVETFNYLIALCVEQAEMIRGFKVVRGKLRTGEKTLIIWRNTVEKSSEDLNEFFRKQKYNTLDFEFDLIFVNGDNNLENLKVAEDKWKVRLIEEEFKRRMFEQAGA